MPPNHSPQSNETRLALIEDRQDRLERTMESVAESLKLLARIAVQSDNIVNSLADIDARVVKIEADWPIVALLKAGALWGVRIVLAGVFVAVLTVAGFKVSP